MSWRAGHATERVRETGPDGEDAKHFEQIGKRRRILERVRAIRVKESAPVRAVFFDDLLRSHRALCDGLRGDCVHHGFSACIYDSLAVSAHPLHLLRLDQFHRVVGLQVLHHSLRDQEQRSHNAKRQKNPQAAAHEVDPEISQGIHLPASNPANEGDCQHDAGRRRRKIVKREASHLREVAHGRLARIGLPVGVGGERRGRIESQVLRGHCPEVLRIERQHTLYALDEIEDQHRHRAEHQHGGRVLGPAHLVRFINAGNAVKQALDGPQHRIEEGALPGEHARHEDAERFRDREDQSQEYENLQPAIDGHFRALRSELLRT